VTLLDLVRYVFVIKGSAGVDALVRIAIPQIVYDRTALLSDNLAGVENTVRVEYPLDLPEERIDLFAIQFREERSPEESVAVFSAQSSSKGDGEVVYLPCYRIDSL